MDLAPFLFKRNYFIFLDTKYSSSYKVIPIIAIALLIGNLQGVFNLMIYQEKKVIQMVLIGILGGIINLALNFILIPKLGIYGAALATMISFLFMFLSVG